MKPIEIVIDDLVLRPWRPDDAGAVYRACQVPYRRRDAEAFIATAPGAWLRGDGAIFAAVRTLCGWGFDELGLHRVTWRAHVGNDPSRRVAEKAGFAFEGVQRGGCAHRGERRDAWVSARLATDSRLGTP